MNKKQLIVAWTGALILLLSSLVFAKPNSDYLLLKEGCGVYQEKKEYQDTDGKGIEIEYPDYSDVFPFQEKEPTHFTLLGLYSPEVLMKEKERLAGLYGKERFQKAIKYAEIVYKGNDIQIIEDIIKKIEEYGIKEVDRAFRIVSGKSYSNPKRSYKYVVGILQTEAKE